jgi:hypothetical protein
MMRVLVLITALAAAACAKQEEAKPTDTRPKMAEGEMERGLGLCKAYVERLCACAANDPSLVDDCDLARSQPDGLGLHVALLKGAKGPLNDEERRITESAARKTIQACADADGALDLSACPRPTGPAPAASPSPSPSPQPNSF